MNEFFKIISFQTFWQVQSRLITGLAAVFLTLILTRNLGVENYGDFTKILALVTIFYLPTDFGLNAVFILRASEKQAQWPIKSIIASQNLNQLFTNLLSARAILSLFWFGISYFANFTLFGVHNLALLLASATILTTAATTTALGYFQLKLAYQWTFLANFFSAIITLITIWLFLPNLNLIVIFGALLAGQIAAVFVNFSKIFLDLKSIFAKVNIWQIKDYLWQSFPLGLALIFNLIAFKVDIIILSQLKSPSSVGLYGLAVRIFEWAIIPPVFILNSAYPILARTYSENFGKFLKISQKLSWFLVSFGILVFLTVFLTAEPLTVLFGGYNFQAGFLALKILAVGTPIFYLTGLIMWLLVILEKKLALVLIYGLGAVVNIILNLIFIPRFDFLAAAVTTVFSEGLILLLGAMILLKFARKENISHSPPR